MTKRFHQVVLVAFLAVAHNEAGAQVVLQRSDTSGARTLERTTPAPLVRPFPAGIRSVSTCEPPRDCRPREGPVPAEDVTRTRSRYALIGFMAGAGAGWLYYSHACSEADCFIPAGGLLFAAAGGLLGMVVGLLIGPAPSS